MPIPTLHLVITGRVQGVGFRWFIQRAAQRLALAGWVRNLADGRVELDAEGTPESIDALLAWCAHGPQGARVTSVDVEDQEPASEGTGFRVVRE